MINELPAAFGHWFAGFADGEGCFQIRRNPQNGCYFTRFEIGLRVDDLPILEEIRDRTGLGRIDLRTARPRSSASAHYLIIKKAECLALVHLFETYPLRAKKARDFEIWAQAVRLWATVRSGQSGPGTNRPAFDWTPFGVLQSDLAAVRAATLADSQTPTRVFG